MPEIVSSARSSRKRPFPPPPAAEEGPPASGSRSSPSSLLSHNKRIRRSLSPVEVARPAVPAPSSPSGFSAWFRRAGTWISGFFWGHDDNPGRPGPRRVQGETAAYAVDMSNRRPIDPPVGTTTSQAGGNLYRDPGLRDDNDSDSSDEVQYLSSKPARPQDVSIGFGVTSAGPLAARRHRGAASGFFNVVTTEKRKLDRQRARDDLLWSTPEPARSQPEVDEIPKGPEKPWWSPPRNATPAGSDNGVGHRKAPFGFPERRKTNWGLFEQLHREALLKQKSRKSYLLPTSPTQSGCVAKTRTPIKTLCGGVRDRADYLRYKRMLAENSSSLVFQAGPAITGLSNRKSLFQPQQASSPARAARPSLPVDIKSPTKRAAVVVITLDDEEDGNKIRDKPERSERASPLTSLTTPTRPTSSAKSPHPEVDVIEVLNTFAPRTKPDKEIPRPQGAGEGHKNMLEAELKLRKEYDPGFLEELEQKYANRRRDSELVVLNETVKARHSRERIWQLERSVEERLKKHLRITEVAIPDPEPEPEVVEEDDFEKEDEDSGAAIRLPELTEEMEEIISKVLANRSSSTTLVDAYKIPITVKDIDTLKGLNWLNDEIINFYMQMIVARSTGDSNKSNKNWPKVYACNTFFYPKLVQGGHAVLKRWTRKVDIFAHDLILVPVHLGMHWCLATVDFRKKGVYYYDSMGGNNMACLKALLNYLKDEHMDKKKTSLDTSGFEVVLVKDIPQQMNGSDCGMFTCKFAEYISRGAAITFTQENMPYFRRRMVYEIVKNNLIYP